MVAPNKAAAAGVTSAILVVAWTGVYLSKHSKGQNTEVEKQQVTAPSIVYEFVTLEEKSNFSAEVENQLRRAKVKEVLTLKKFRVIVSYYIARKK